MGTVRFQNAKSSWKEVAGLKKKDSSPCQEAMTRGNMYHFLSAVFLNPPSENFLKCIGDRDLIQELSRLFGQKVAAELKEFAAAAHSREDIASLKQEYMDLFAVPTGRYVLPFEDVYRGMTADGKQERGPLLGNRAIAVTRIYREGGAEIERTCKELPTHIGVEIAFMSFLCEREALAILDRQGKSVDSDKHRQLQVRFLEEHLNQWFPQLSRSIQKNAKSRFYPGLALIAEAFLAQDTASLSGKLRSERKVSQKGEEKSDGAQYLECSTQCCTE
jgi:TorA maturation chaperone TorD